MKPGLMCAVLMACSFNVPSAGILKCEPDGTCPMDYTCVQEYCIPGPPGPMPGMDAAVGNCAIAIGAGHEHSCAVRSDGTAQCWGRNDRSQLGDQGVLDQPLPVAVTMLSGATAVGGGDHHSCAIVTDGKVQCWGRNNTGQLGDGSAMRDSTTPVLVRGVSGAVQLAIADVHSCARLSDDRVTCWGNNEVGQLGDGTTFSRSMPLPVDGVEQVAALAAGGATTCAVDRNRVLKCWGFNGAGQLADGSQEARNAAVVWPVADVTGVAVGDSFVCALTASGDVLCAGSNRVLGTDEDSTMPLRIALPVHPKAIIAGAGFACATDDRDRLWCWGDNQSFELGDMTDQFHPSPVLTAYTNVAEVVAGHEHLCVRSKDNSISCSGYNGRGQIGDGFRTTVGVPKAVPGLTGVSSIAGGDSFTCAVLMDKTVVCWGENDSGQLGDGSRIDRPTPVPVESLAGVTLLAAGRGFTCALLDDGKVACWGRNERSQLGDGSDSEPRSAPRPVMNLAGVSQLAAARDHACALAGEAVWCWGDNSEGQNGDSTNITSPVPHKVTLGATNVAGVGVAAGAAHACAIDFNHKVWCWGSNFFGQLGNGAEAPSSNVPVQVSGLSDVDQVVARGDFTCARRSTDSSVWCWGDSGLGQLGNEDRPANGGPRKVQRVASAIQITTGFHHACARKPENTLACWGGNFAGQVGDGSYEDAHLPVDIAGLADVIEIAGGDQHTCAVLTGGTVTCWGDDRRGQLGDGVAARRIPAVAKFACE